MMRELTRFLPLFILLTSVFSMPVRDTRDRGSEEDSILIDQALLKILEAEDELASVAQEIEELHEHRDHTLEKDSDLEDVTVPKDQLQSDQPLEDQLQGDQLLEDQLQSDQPLEDQLQGDQLLEDQLQGDQLLEDQFQGDQPMEDLPQGDMPIEGPIDDNEAQDVGASPTPPILRGVNTSIPPDRQFQEFANGEVRQRLLQWEYIRDKVWNYTRPGNNSAFPSKIPGKRVDAEVLKWFNNSQPKTLSVSIQDLLKNATYINNNGFTKMQSLYPSCEIPKNTDEEMWLPGENSFSMNLLFDFNQTKIAGNGLDVREATLRLYKIAQTQESGPWITSCIIQSAGGKSGNGSNPAGISTTSENPATEEQRTTRHHADQLVRVSVYLYTRALKKNRVKRKLLESRTIPLNKDEWTAWNVLTAAKVYLQTRRNFGLLVEVEDEKGCLLPARRIFKGMNCTGETATARPLPYPIMKVNDILNRDSFPIMDIRSYEIHVPSTDVDIFTTTASQTSDSELSDQTFISRPARRSSPTPSSLDGHRHRHGDNVSSGNHRRRRKPQNSTKDEYTGISDLRSLIIPQRIIMTAEEQRRRLSTTTTPQPVAR